jgi:hypothetical protein
METTQCSETSAFNTQTPGKYPEDNSSQGNVALDVMLFKTNFECVYVYVSKFSKLLAANYAAVL